MLKFKMKIESHTKVMVTVHVSMVTAGKIEKQ
jgi:hypothetical protein